MINPTKHPTIPAGRRSVELKIAGNVIAPTPHKEHRREKILQIDSLFLSEKKLEEAYESNT